MIIKDILARVREIAADYDAMAEAGPFVRVEHAAQVAELANAERTHDVFEKSADYLDGYVDGFERAAELIRMIPEVKL